MIRSSVETQRLPFRLIDIRMRVSAMQISKIEMFMTETSSLFFVAGFLDGKSLLSLGTASKSAYNTVNRLLENSQKLPLGAAREIYTIIDNPPLLLLNSLREREKLFLQLGSEVISAAKVHSIITTAITRQEVNGDLNAYLKDILNLLSMVKPRGVVFKEGRIKDYGTFLKDITYLTLQIANRKDVSGKAILSDLKVDLIPKSIETLFSMVTNCGDCKVQSELDARETTYKIIHKFFNYSYSNTLPVLNNKIPEILAHLQDEIFSPNLIELLDSIYMELGEGSEGEMAINNNAEDFINLIHKIPDNLTVYSQSWMFSLLALLSNSFLHTDTKEEVKQIFSAKIDHILSLYKLMEQCDTKVKQEELKTLRFLINDIQIAYPETELC